MKRIIREAAKYKALRQQVAEELPDIVARHHMAPILTMRHLRSLHEMSSQHDSLLAMTKECSCFYCCKKFKTSQVKEWIPRAGSAACWGGGFRPGPFAIGAPRFRARRGHKSAMCPLCKTDSVLPFVLPQKALLQMNKYWFGTCSTSMEVGDHQRLLKSAMSKLSRPEKMALGLLFEDEIQGNRKASSEQNH